MRIFISGVSCVGKSTVGRQLAEATGYRFLDLDNEVEQYFGKPIFYLQKEGIGLESYRAKLALVLKNIVTEQRDDYIIALPPSGFRSIYWKIIQSVNPTTMGSSRSG